MNSRKGFLIIWIFLEDDKSLHDGSVREVLLRRQLGSFAVGQENRRCMSLESGDCFRFAGLAYNINSLADSDRDRQGLADLVEGDEHSRLHGRGQAVQKVVRFAQDGRLDVEEADDCAQESSDCDWRHQLKKSNWMKCRSKKDNYSYDLKFG